MDIVHAIAPYGSDVSQDELDATVRRLVEKKYRESLVDVERLLSNVHESTRQTGNASSVIPAKARAHLDLIATAASELQRLHHVIQRRLEALEQCTDPAAPAALPLSKVS